MHFRSKYTKMAAWIKHHIAYHPARCQKLFLKLCTCIPVLYGPRKNGKRMADLALLTFKWICLIYTHRERTGSFHRIVLAEKKKDQWPSTRLKHLHQYFKAFQTHRNLSVPFLISWHLHSLLIFNGNIGHGWWRRDPVLPLTPTQTKLWE